MKQLVVSCVERVPELVDRYRPDGVLSIAAKPLLGPALLPRRHVSLAFADIDDPTPRNWGLAAKADDIDAILSLRDCDGLLIHCQQGHRRSPSAALILLNAAYPECTEELAGWIWSVAPYVDFNTWMLTLAGISLPADCLGRPRLAPPRGASFVLDLADAPC